MTTPVAKLERIDSLDTVRGLAVLGILMPVPVLVAGVPLVFSA